MVSESQVIPSMDTPELQKTKEQARHSSHTWKKALVASKCSHKAGSRPTTYLATSFDEYLDRLEKPTSLSWRTYIELGRHSNMGRSKLTYWLGYVKWLKKNLLSTTLKHRKSDPDKRTRYFTNDAVSNRFSHIINIK